MGYLNLIGSFSYKTPLFRSTLDALAENDAQLKTDGWAQSTKTLFFQAAAPVGWTQDVSQNDKALRVVGPVGGGGAGGVTPLSSAISLAHVHTISPDDAHAHPWVHTHTFSAPVASFDNFRGFATMAYADNTAFLLRKILGSGSSFNAVKALLSATPVVLSTFAAHDHGGSTLPQLTDLTLAYCDVIVATKNAPVGIYTDLTTFWHTGDKADFDPFAAYAGNDASNFASLMPAGTIMIFGQSSAPAGWTMQSAVNDRMLRIVSGVGGGIGGTQAISSGIPLAHSHGAPASADHTHAIPNHVHAMSDTESTTGSDVPPSAGRVLDIGGVLVRSADSGALDTRKCYTARSTNSGAGTTSAAGAHSHQFTSALADVILAYVDVIQCSKDSAGAPGPYTDFTAEFAWKKLISRQRLNTLAQNDTYIQYHTTPSGTQAFFFMASPPVGWVKLTAQHDKPLRIVSGGSGGNAGGGLALLSQTIPLAHLHPIVAAGSHTHTAYHGHGLDSTMQSNVYPPAPINVGKNSGSIGQGGWFASDITFTSGVRTSGPLQNQTSAVFGDGRDPLEIPDADPDHNHGGFTDSRLTDVALAYADVIWCSKT